MYIRKFSREFYFLRKALKVIFATLKILDYGMIYLYKNDIVIVRNRADFIFTKLRIREISRK